MTSHHVDVLASSINLDLFSCGHCLVWSNDLLHTRSIISRLEGHNYSTTLCIPALRRQAHGLVSFVTFYHKGYSVSRSTKIIHWYLPEAISELLVYDLS
jgi:hypothetical protein